MPKLTEVELQNRAQAFANLYIKHKGNKSRIAKELGITRTAVGIRSRNAVGEKAQEIIETEVQKVARKLDIDLQWYINKLKDGATKPKLTYQTFVSKKNPDYSIRHKYLVTLGEALKYLKQPDTSIDNSRHLHLTVEKKEAILENIRTAVAKGLI